MSGGRWFRITKVKFLILLRANSGVPQLGCKRLGAALTCNLSPLPNGTMELRMSILWTIIIGFIAGVIAKLIHSGPMSRPASY